MQKIFGHVRVSTQEQNLGLQLDALVKVGATDIIEQRSSGTKADRPEMLPMLSLVREATRLLYGDWTDWPGP